MKYFCIYPILLLTILSCGHSFLDLKPDQELLVPESLEDLQAMLDNSAVFNLSTSIQGIIAADEYYLDYDRWNTVSVPAQKNGYIWATEGFYEGRSNDGWDMPYKAIFYSNLMLERLEKIAITQGNDQNVARLRGGALFFRAWHYFNLAQIYCSPYQISQSSQLLGMPLRVNSDINITSSRSSLEETYGLIFDDLSYAIRYLPNTVDIPTRPSKAAAYALLAKLKLQIGDYVSALKYVDSCLLLKHNLIDYNLLSSENNFPFARFNDEVILHSSNTGIILSNTRLNPDTLLYESYDENDLRKNLFFQDNNGRLVYRGSYDGSSRMFLGIATDEMYLLRAECRARLGMIATALEDVNHLLSNRMATEGFTPVINNSPSELLDVILNERKKQLIYRGTRWHDLRRLNDDPNYATTLKRELNGEIYELQSRDNRYALPIPDLVLELSGIQQNPGY